MTTAVPTPHSVPPVLMPWDPTHYGCRVVEFGEDGDYFEHGGYFAVAGPIRDEHVPDRRALAAVLHWLRVDCSYTRDDLRDLFGEIRKIEQRWVTPVDDDEEPWQWSDHPTTAAWAVTYVETY